MALILRKESNLDVTTPPEGSGSIFLSEDNAIVVKGTTGEISTALTFEATTNTQVFFNDNGELGQSNTFTFNKTSNSLSVNSIRTDNYLDASGNPIDFQQAQGPNNAIQFNDDGDFGGNANLTYNSGTNTLTVNGGTIVAGTIDANLSANARTSITSVGVLSSLEVSGNTSLANVSASNLTTTGNAVVGGNLVVNGNLTYVNVEHFNVEDPLISLGSGPNGDPLTSNDGKDRGLILHYYTTEAVDAWMGWDNSNAEFVFASEVDLGNNEIANIEALGNVRADTFIGDLLGNVNFAAQPNITSVGTLTSLLTGATANASDFPNAIAIVSQDNTGETDAVLSGLVAEAAADESESSTPAVGVYGIGRTNGNVRATGVQGKAVVTSTSDPAPAVGVRGYSLESHADGYNIGVLGNAMGSGIENYAFYIQNGGIGSIENDTFWDLADDSNAALTFHSPLKANIFGIETTEGAEGIFTTGYLNVSGNAAVGGILTDNYYLANGDPVDFQQAAGSNNQIQFNANSDFGASANLTFDPSTNELSVIGTLSVSGNANLGNVGADTGSFVSIAGNLTTAAQPNITSVGTLTSLDVTGNLSANLITGTLTTAAQPNITSVGELTSLTISGNASAGNVSATDVSATTLGGTLTTASQPNVTSVGTLTSLDVTGNVSAGNVSATDVSATTLGGTLTTAAQPNVTSVGELTSLIVTGNVNAGNVSATGITATTLGGTLTTAAQPNVTSVGELTSLIVTGNASAGNISSVGTLSITGNANVGNIGATNGVFTALSGNLTTNAQPNITSVGTLTSLDVTGNITAGDISAANASFTGSGSFGANVNMGNSHIINLADPVNASDAATKEYVDEVAQGLQARTAARVKSDSNLVATYDNGTAGVGATLTSTSNVAFPAVDGVSSEDLNVVAMRILVNGQDNAEENGLYVLDQIGIEDTQPWILRRCKECDTDEKVPGSFVFVKEGTVYGNTGWVAVVALPFTIGTDPISWTQFSGAGTFTAGSGLTLDGTEFSVNAAQPGITSVGTLTGLAVNGNIVAANITANTGVFTGNGAGLTNLAGANVTGQVANALVAGTVYTNAQPNITSVGELTSLAVTGNASAGNLSTGGTLSVTGNANVGNIGAAAGVFSTVSGNGRGLFSLSASNIDTGTLDQARLANSSLTVNGQTISLGGSGTVTANTPQSLTPGSFLTGDSFNGGTARTFAVDATSANTASKVVARDASGNFSAGTITATLSGAATTAGTVTTAAQPNITSVGTLTSLAISGTNTLTVRTISTGANTTTGTITGNWSLSAGSRLNATYADLAECYVADQPYEPGTVLLFAGEHEVSAEGIENSHAVAGVVSTKPAYLMNSECQGEHVVELALIGRVPCKVQGPVNKGDLIVSSDKAGYGKVNNEARAGTIVGKALSTLGNEEGTIEILVGRS